MQKKDRSPKIELKCREKLLEQKIELKEESKARERRERKEQEEAGIHTVGKMCNSRCQETKG